VLAVRERWAQDNPDLMLRLVRAHGKAAAFIEKSDNHPEVAAILAAPNRVGVAAEVIMRTLAGRLKVLPDGTVRTSDRYLLVGRANAARPDPVQAAWLYAQMVRWKQTELSDKLLAQAQAVFRPDVYDKALGGTGAMSEAEPADGIGAFTGPAFQPKDISRYLASWRIPG
jgi:two-component system, oxyanion-binding sensor